MIPLAVERIDRIKSWPKGLFLSKSFLVLSATPFELQRCLKGSQIIHFSLTEQTKLAVYVQQICTSTVLNAGDVKLNTIGCLHSKGL